MQGCHGQRESQSVAALSLVRFRYICVLDRRDHPELDLDTLEWQGETPVERQRDEACEPARQRGGSQPVGKGRTDRMRLFRPTAQGVTTGCGISNSCRLKLSPNPEASDPLGAALPRPCEPTPATVVGSLRLRASAWHQTPCGNRYSEASERDQGCRRDS